MFSKIDEQWRKKNKKKTRKFLMKYLIKHVIVSSYNLQANEMIKKSHQLIINMLFKLMNDFIRHDQNNWITHLFSVFLADQTIIRTSTEMTSFHMMYEYEMILLIKFNVLTWQQADSKYLKNWYQYWFFKYWN